MADFNPSADLAGGRAYVKGLTQDAREAGAFNALSKIYGPVAGDPEAALKMQDYGQKLLTNPIAVDQAKADLSGKQEDNNFLAQDHPLQVQSHQLINAHQTEANAQQLQMDPLELADKKEAVAYNALAHPLELQGKKLTNEGLVDTNAATVQKTAQSAQEFPLKMDLDRAEIGLKKGQTSAAYAQAQHSLAEAAKARTAVANGHATPAQALAVIQQRMSVVPDTVDQAIGLIKSMSSVGLLRAAKSKMPGTAEDQYNKAIDTIKANMSMNDLQAMKASGVGFGRVTNAEMAAAANAFGSLDVTQDPKTMINNLARIKAFSQALGAQGAATPGRPSAPGAPKGNSFTVGQVYKDSKGNVARYSQDGSFVPVK